MSLTTIALETRCSSLPLNFTCPGSLAAGADEVLVDATNPAAVLGTATHDVLATDILRQMDGNPPADVDECAFKHGVDKDELGMLVWYGRKMWEKFKAYFPHPRVEMELRTHEEIPFKLTGHADLGDFHDGVVYILDWKTGRCDADYYHQLAGYAWLSLFEWPQAHRVVVIVAWLRDQTYESAEFGVDELLEWADRFEHEVMGWDGVYRPGAHCTHCRRLNSCPARRAMARSTVTELMGAPDGGELDMPISLDVYRRVKLIEAKCKEYRDLVRTHVAVNGPLAGDGRELALVDTSRDTIDPEKAWPVITEYLDHDQLLPAFKVNKSTLLDAVAKKAARGQKKKQKAAFMAALTEAAAVSTTTISRLTERRTPEQENESDGEEN